MGASLANHHYHCNALPFSEGINPLLGLTTADLKLGDIANPEVPGTVTCLVDCGAVYSVVPRDVLERLKFQPLATEKLCLAGGEMIVRQKGGALFRDDGRVGLADVIFGEDGDLSPLGALTLGALGLSLDPLRRELKPLPLVL